MKQRSEIDERYKWDLTKFCKNDEDFYARLEKVDKQIKNFKKYENKLGDEAVLFECLENETKLVKEFSLIAIYAGLRQCEDNADRKANEMNESLSYVSTRFQNETAFIDVEITKLPTDKIKSLQENKKFANYKRFFEGILREKKHILSKKEELLLSKIDECLGGESSTFDKFADVDLKFDDILDEKGKKHELNQSNYGVYFESNDRTLRKNVFKELNGKYGEFIHFVANNYINNVKGDCVFAKIRGYKSALAASIYCEEASEDVYNLLIKKVRENIGILYDYFEIKRQMLGLDKFAVYDNFAPVVSSLNKKFSYDEAIDIIKEAVSVLGEDYVNLIQRAKDERWIDVMPNKNKDSGAFSNGTFGATPVVLTNFEGNLESVFTLAHELGHAMHTYHSNKKQPIQTADYVIFVAEVASTVNEMLLLNYFLKRAKTKKEKIYFYDHFLKQAKSTIYRQTMFAEFEQFAHEEYEKEHPLSAHLLCEKYKQLNDFYFGKKVEQLPEMQYEWARIPHFYRSFYVYKYATGLISAIRISNKLLEEKNFAKKYIKFLSSGCSADPISLLKIADCDLTKEETFDESFAVCRDIVNKWKEIL
ncbi:MAG: oligoendopeptidase F [Clostridia bacterium]|nr:oligoendopeptidase F [Clostridia bacterium]